MNANYSIGSLYHFVVVYNHQAVVYSHSTLTGRTSVNYSVCSGPQSQITSHKPLEQTLHALPSLDHILPHHWQLDCPPFSYFGASGSLIYFSLWKNIKSTVLKIYDLGPIIDCLCIWFVPICVCVVLPQGSAGLDTVGCP